jgi:hypothetical protein
VTPPVPRAPAAPPPDAAALRRLLLSSSIGTVIEWYDFFVFASAAALVFDRVFFPNADPLSGVLLSLMTYAVGFVTRPLGGVVFGVLGDRHGRKRVLVWSLMLMGLATVAVGLVPSYATIGVAAPVLLVVLRLVQGFAVGGEVGGAVLLVAEPRRACSRCSPRRSPTRTSSRGGGASRSSSRGCSSAWACGCARASRSRRSTATCSRGARRGAPRGRRSGARSPRTGARCSRCCS